jgi:hypothetical protein
MKPAPPQSDSSDADYWNTPTRAPIDTLSPAELTSEAVRLQCEVYVMGALIDLFERAQDLRTELSSPSASKGTPKEYVALSLRYKRAADVADKALMAYRRQSDEGSRLTPAGDAKGKR